MREIKFRGRNKFDKWYFGSLYVNDDGQTFIDKSNWKREEVIPETVGQFTGLWDGNGKEIYEADIVKTHPGHVSRISKDWVEYSCGIIEWVCEGFKVCQKYIGANWISSYAMCNCCPCGLEIIGNIHENPELIKEGEKSEC